MCILEVIGRWREDISEAIDLWCYECSPGIRIKGLKRNEVMRYPASDRIISKHIKPRVLGNVDSTT